MTKEKLYVVRKFIKATSITDALRKDKKHPADEVYLESKPANEPPQGKEIGFKKKEK